MGIKEVLIAPRSSYQNLYVERVISSSGRDMLDRVIVLSKRHLRRLLTQYVAYDHQFRTHLSLAMDCPESRPLEPPETGEVISMPEIGGLPHHCERQAA
jgi:putative transposase